MKESIETVLAKMNIELRSINKKLDGHLSEHFKMRLAAYGFTATLIISLLVIIL